MEIDWPYCARHFQKFLFNLHAIAVRLIVLSLLADEVDETGTCSNSKIPALLIQ
jgi:hypothetical protein